MFRIVYTMTLIDSQKRIETIPFFPSFFPLSFFFLFTPQKKKKKKNFNRRRSILPDERTSSYIKEKRLRGFARVKKNTE